MLFPNDIDPLLFPCAPPKNNITINASNTIDDIGSNKSDTINKNDSSSSVTLIEFVFIAPSRFSIKFSTLGIFTVFTFESFLILPLHFFRHILFLHQ